MDIGALTAAVRRWWWIVALVPIVALAGTLILSRFQPYQSQVRATVLIPGDTDLPGNAERPELMVLDDLPLLIESWVFADAVHDEMSDTSLTIGEVQDALSASRYSRVLTVSVTSDDEAEALQIAAAVEAVLPEAVNAYLMPEGGESATVRIIDPPTAPTRSRDGFVLQSAIVTVLAVFGGVLLALAADWIAALRSANSRPAAQTQRISARKGQSASDS